MINQILEKAGLKYEDLNQAEKETYRAWLKELGKNKLTISSIKVYLASMRTSVAMDVTTTRNKSKKDLLLKARLRNYMLLEAFLESPEKARAAIEQTIGGIASKKVDKKDF